MGMTIDEAIERLAKHTFKPTSEPGREYNNALKLGIEAMKRIRHDREAMQAKHILLLPGETEE
ncbi:hypothetical protein ES703_66392 [subsurface metagenome]